MPTVGVVLPAGGRGLRAGVPEPKQFLALRPGRPLFLYALETFHRLDRVGAIALVLPPERLTAFSHLSRDWPKLRLVAGGAERWESVRSGVQALESSLDYVLIHDAARPFVSRAVLGRCLAALASDACVIAALPAVDTIKQVDGSAVRKTLDRRRLIQVQTPQAFPRPMLDALYATPWKGEAPSDEALMAEKAGFPVRWVRGAEANRKVTGSADVAWAGWMAGRLEAGEDIADE